jgi:Fe-S cluster biogenesis protein NfuA
MSDCAACSASAPGQPRAWVHYAGSCGGCASRLAASRAHQRMLDTDRERAISDAARVFRVPRQEVDRWLTS